MTQVQVKVVVEKQVANMKVAEMRKVASQYGIKSASKYKREVLSEMLFKAMLNEQLAKLAKKSQKSTQGSDKIKRYKAEEVDTEAIEGLADAIVANGFGGEDPFHINRKVLIAVMKKLHCAKWYRTYDKKTMVALISEKLV